MLVQDEEAVKRALAAGQLTVADSATGYHRAIGADCPNDGHPATVWRVVRGSGQAITELTMHCPSCGGAFIPKVESLYLR
ncbi:MAG TPA: hypothetical protein VG370_30220 [Chloroflexota bacterium]|jgi:hypothetical protein|nr:hypothetical protein [Chloroflexota bacterium]